MDEQERVVSEREVMQFSGIQLYLSSFGANVANMGNTYELVQAFRIETNTVEATMTIVVSWEDTHIDDQCFNTV